MLIGATGSREPGRKKKVRKGKQNKKQRTQQFWGLRYYCCHHVAERADRRTDGRREEIFAVFLLPPEPVRAGVMRKPKKIQGVK